MTSQFRLTVQGVCEIEEEMYREIDDTREEEEGEYCTVVRACDLQWRLAALFAAASCKMLLDEVPRMVKQRPVEIHIFDLVGHNLCTVHPESFDSQNNVSKITIEIQNKYLSPSAVTTCNCCALAGGGLMNRGHPCIWSKILRLPRINNSSLLRSRQFQVPLWVHSMAGVGTRLIWRIRYSNWRRGIVRCVLRRIRSRVRSRWLYGLTRIMRERDGGLTVVSANFFRDILGNMRPSMALAPTHGNERKLLLLTHRIRSM
jgi:hypothetical protein